MRNERVNPTLLAIIGSAGMLWFYMFICFIVDCITGVR